ncbi:VOC family protein [Cytobacillus firmus]|uniref:VOC domain-containing protein n=1 Tax=Cytobacillus firmus DS1 TaxID=1307436 RepID=W7L7M5_CYTFI|nr:VOC family protein [Cytobacillus firmus]EWG11277.1 hypothetical protein PBF_09642 [Cytobacillus firmus DS1]
MAKVVGFELNCQDPEKAAEFYSKVFRWEIEEPKWGYRPVHTEGAQNQTINGGISKGPSDYPHGTRIQIEVESIDEAISLATENGAMVVRDKMEFADFYLAYLADPVGLGFGLIQKKR